MEAISYVWRYQPRGALLINPPSLMGPKLCRVRSVKTIVFFGVKEVMEWVNRRENETSGRVKVSQKCSDIQTDFEFVI